MHPARQGGDGRKGEGNQARNHANKASGSAIMKKEPGEKVARSPG